MSNPSLEMLDLFQQRNVIDAKIREHRIRFLTMKLNSIPAAFISFHRLIPTLFQELIGINLQACFHRADELLDILETILDIDHFFDLEQQTNQENPT